MKDKNYKEAIKFIEKHAKSNDIYSMYKYGRMLSLRLGSKLLLCILLIKIYKYNLNQIIKELRKQPDISNDDINSIIKLINNQQLENPSIFDHKFNYYKNIVYLYNIFKNVIQLSDLNKRNEVEENIQFIKDITSEFYEGFGSDILFNK